MKISDIVKSKKGYVYIDTCDLVNPFANLLDSMGLGNDNAVGKPFETMVFKCNKEGRVTSWEDLDGENYYTWKEALKGHKRMVAKWKVKESKRNRMTRFLKSKRNRMTRFLKGSFSDE